MNAISKACLITGGVTTAQIGFLLLMYFMGVRNLGQALLFTLYLASFIFISRASINLLYCSGMGYSTHPGIMWMPFLAIAVGLLYYIAGPSAFGVVLVTGVNGFLMGCDALDLADESERHEFYPSVPGQMLFILAAPQAIIALVAVAALVYGF